MAARLEMEANGFAWAYRANSKNDPLFASGALYKRVEEAPAPVEDESPKLAACRA
jgi:hypothetical protein